MVPPLPLRAQQLLTSQSHRFPPQRSPPGSALSVWARVCVCWSPPCRQLNLPPEGGSPWWQLLVDPPTHQVRALAGRPIVRSWFLGSAVIPGDFELAKDVLFSEGSKVAVGWPKSAGTCPTCPLPPMVCHGVVLLLYGCCLTMAFTNAFMAASFDECCWTHQ